jgi:hypothetical protein
MLSVRPFSDPVPLIDDPSVVSLVAVQRCIISRDARHQKTLTIPFHSHHVSCVMAKAIWHHLVRKTRTRVSILMGVAANSVAKRLILPRTVD